jgi:hypothetical protein
VYSLVSLVTDDRGERERLARGIATTGLPDDPLFVILLCRDDSLLAEVVQLHNALRPGHSIANIVDRLGNVSFWRNIADRPTNRSYFRALFHKSLEVDEEHDKQAQDK